jgi:hypothetical protein
LLNLRGLVGIQKSFNLLEERIMNKLKNLHTAFWSKRFVVVAVLFSLFALSENFATSNAQTRTGCGLGTIWAEYESGWTGKWTRRGTSNVFDARWERSGWSPIENILTININGSNVSIHRQDPNISNNTCAYKGKIASDGVTVSGEYTCNDRGTIHGPYSWNATILCSTGCGLGKSWNEEESGWRSVWTRRGNSNVFDASYTGPSGERASTVNTVTIEGNRVSINRTSSSEGNLCRYEGTIQADGVTITGTYNCRDGVTRNWRATINCGSSH